MKQYGKWVNFDESLPPCNFSITTNEIVMAISKDIFAIAKNDGDTSLVSIHHNKYFDQISIHHKNNSPEVMAQDILEIVGALLCSSYRAITGKTGTGTSKSCQITLDDGSEMKVIEEFITSLEVPNED